jgi:formylmethanofuran dehydrogenase subunit E
MRKSIAFAMALLVAFSTSALKAHELWFHSHSGGEPNRVRLSFGDTPDFGEAERVAEIAQTRVWADGKPLEVKRLPDGLEARLPEHRPAVLSAYADRGVVDYMGDSFVILLAAYSQARAIKAEEASNLGLGDDQVRLLLISKEDGPPVVRAVWKGMPATGASVKIYHGRGEPTEVRTDNRGEVPCPDLREGPWSLLVQVMDNTPGKRDDRNYTHIRYKATLAIDQEAAFGPAVAACLARVKEVHGEAGPWAVTGYRIGERALKELGLARHSHELMVIHYCPAEVQFSCIADGVQAATGASPGKLNLRVETAPPDALRTEVRNRKSGQSVTFILKPEFSKSISNLSSERLGIEGRRVAELPDDAIFSVTERK